ncbi:MAG TPA: hypothetical protein VMV77_16595 [Bacteroidales bacterium]|nr:hypothetical protein [Bacteroidales bacterium]
MLKKLNIEIHAKVQYNAKVLVFILTVIILNACSGKIPTFTELNMEVQILPDYSGITLPPNIAPLNFTIKENGEKYLTKIYESGGETIIIKSSTGHIRIPEGKWKKLLQKCKGKDMFVEILIKKDGGWLKFPTIINHVAVNPIDSYVVYRLIDPGFELWNKMGIYQRCLENFAERPIMINNMSDDNCMNCHSFCLNDSHTMMFHMRSKYSGTIIYREGKVTKVDTKTDQTISPGVYPAWHPGGRYIAYSVNNIVQAFHSVRQIKVEVTDTLSDVIVLDTEKNNIFTSPSLTSKERFETFPTWSPDGKYLYYCSARALPLAQYSQIRYDLLRISFDLTTCRFGAVDTIVSASTDGHSVSFPRISPDGKYLLFCMSDFGNFSIWHSESDLYLKNLDSGEISKPEINSKESESYHTWSSDGRWIVFSSRRIDGLHTRLYFSYFDTDGRAHKPFLLPQKNPVFYSTFLKSYNVPELITTEVELNPRKLMKAVKSEPVRATFKDISP